MFNQENLRTAFVVIVLDNSEILFRSVITILAFTFCIVLSVNDVEIELCQIGLQ